jgi:hypothetical protein
MSIIYKIQERLLQAHWLSLDVAIGAVVSHRMAARLPDGHQPEAWAIPILLAFSVFIIYAADRLLDVATYQPARGPMTPRHRYHGLLKNWLVRILAGLVVVSAVLLFWLPKPVLILGVILAVICGLYVWGVARLPPLHPALIWKEPIVGVVYAVAIWGCAWVIKPVISWGEIGLGVAFLAIALQNILLFSLMEFYEYPESSFSLATVWGPERTDATLRVLMSLVLLLTLAVFLFVDDHFTQRAAVIEGIMSAVLYIIQRYPTYFLRYGRYRWIGDGIFWLPFLIL